MNSSTGQPEISVVVCAYTEKRCDDLVVAITSLQQQTLVPHEVILVIDHNRALLEWAQEKFAEFGLVHMIENLETRGLSGARNSGIAACTGAIIAFMDEDAEASPTWLETLAAHYADDKVMGVGGSIHPRWMNPAGKPAWFPEEFNWVVGCTYKGMPEQPAPVRNLIGCNMSLRREVFEKAGKFRVGRVGALSIGLENDDTEMCIRAQQHFPTCIFLYDPSVRIINHRVPAVRKSFSYFSKRCLSEGISKARLSGMVGKQSGLSNERTYVAQTLPQGVLRGLKDTLRGDLSGIGRAFAISVGLLVTVAGFCVGKVIPKPHQKSSTFAQNSGPAFPDSHPAQIS
jgi:glucosyl-dolichyl phosphate glucuronosyltransferase